MTQIINHKEFIFHSSIFLVLLEKLRAMPERPWAVDSSAETSASKAVSSVHHYPKDKHDLLMLTPDDIVSIETPRQRPKIGF